VEDLRLEKLKQWLSTLPQLQEADLSQLEPASSDASFRRYFRVYRGWESYIVMDAPPDKEDCHPFVQVDGQLQQLGVRVPSILAQDLVQGFLLLEDFGRETLFDRLKTASESEVDCLYRQALDILVRLQNQAIQPQNQKPVQSLPSYSEALLRQEMSLFSDWLLQTHLQIPLSTLERQAWQAVIDLLVHNAQIQPKTYVLRDYHSRNLMILPADNPQEIVSCALQGSDGVSIMFNLGVIDFQDAVQGALTYDAISLLRDCYQRWPAEQVVEWQRYYFLTLAEANPLGRTGDFDKKNWSEFQKAMDLMGIQRHLKAAGIFARLFHRDGKAGYLGDIPNTLQYLYEVGQQYKTMLPLVRLLENRVLPAMEAMK